MTIKKVTRMNEGARLDAGDDLAEQLAQMKIAQEKLSKQLDGKVAEGSSATAAQMKQQQDDKEEYDAESDDQELSEQLATLVLGDPNPEKKKRKKRRGKKSKKSAEQKAADEKTAQEKEEARQKEIVEMAQKMADDIVKKMGVLNLYRYPNSTNTTQKETETASREMTTKQALPVEKTSTKGKKKMNTDKLIEDWNEYFGEGELEDWRRLCRDLGLPDDLPSKTKCRDAVKGVHVNIRQFLDAQRKPEDVIFFKNVWKLASWTFNKRLRVRLDAIPRGTPLRSLMRELSRY
ncbi:hypothetical protein CkaCkLH20_03522 [Colletotrichum karsti]|uniref:Uncharacterized protein n=1 Tax=Colletotrichum karsti TaxID=1095194 RepID=A0A9P6IAL8_9PEZI|nr:uncharacterized protein CkaCkLH20_03522 [Colletotrichum karsti]KAF9879289.1 hypothetical protein CkaCkLH20_03522 [Colletotrichum karsti]